MDQRGPPEILIWVRTGRGSWGGLSGQRCSSGWESGVQLDPWAGPQVSERVRLSLVITGGVICDQGWSSTVGVVGVLGRAHWGEVKAARLTFAQSKTYRQG